ncbi:hypothetical protein V5O48_002039 [Marasmius crinis-equi]|uniref:Uncharacterized protein n=1 Tax=Marasmius crinis-equi TaxID=585013 RepID=A0ABR3FWQ3_9AGAR
MRKVAQAFLDREGLVGFLQDTLGVVKWTLLSNKLSRSSARLLDYLVKAEIVKEALRTSTAKPFKHNISTAKRWKPVYKNDASLFRRVVLELSGWSDTQFSSWGNRSDNIATLGLRDSRLQGIGRALEKRLSEHGIKHELAFATDMSDRGEEPDVISLTGKELDAIIREAKRMVSRPVQSLKPGIAEPNVANAEPQGFNTQTSTFQVFRACDFTAQDRPPRRKRKRAGANPAPSIQESKAEHPANPKEDQDSVALGSRKKAKPTPPCPSSPPNSDANISSFEHLLHSLVESVNWD